MFGAQQNRPLFGAAPSTSAFGFGQSQTPNVFGAQSQQPATGTGTNLFGGAQPSTGLFGASTQAQPQQQQQQQQQQQPTGIFGQPAPTGLFGSTTTQPQQQQPQTTSLFGSSQPTAFGGFGTSAAGQQNQPGTTSLFGQPAQPQAQQTLVQQPQQFGQQSAGVNGTTGGTGPLFTKTTKFNDLPEDVRKKFEQIDAHIQGRVQISTELKQHKLGDEPQKGAEQIRVVHKDLVNSINKLRADIAAMRELRVRMDQAVQDTIAATRTIDAFKTSQSGQSSAAQSQQTVWLKNYAGFPLEFFTRVTEQLKERLQWFNTTLEQIERKLVSEANHVSITPQSVTSTLQAQHASFVALANKTAALDGELQKLKHTYRTLWRARTGSARDPFNELDRGTIVGGGELGIEGLKVA